MSDRYDTDNVTDDAEPDAAARASEAAGEPIDGTAEAAGGDVADWGYPQKKRRVTKELVFGVAAMIMLLGVVGVVAQRSLKSGSEVASSENLEVPNSSLGDPSDGIDPNDPFRPGAENDLLTAGGPPTGNNEPLPGDPSADNEGMVAGNSGDGFGSGDPFGSPSGTGVSSDPFGGRSTGAGTASLSPGSADPFGSDIGSGQTEPDPFATNDQSGSSAVAGTTTLFGDAGSTGGSSASGNGGLSNDPFADASGDAGSGPGSSSTICGASSSRIDPFTGRPASDRSGSTLGGGSSGRGTLSGDSFADNGSLSNGSSLQPDSGTIEFGSEPPASGLPDSQLIDPSLSNSSLAGSQPSDPSLAEPLIGDSLPVDNGLSDSPFGSEPADGSMPSSRSNAIGLNDPVIEPRDADPGFGIQPGSSEPAPGDPVAIDPGLADPSLSQPEFGQPDLGGPALMEPSLADNNPGGSTFESNSLDSGLSGNSEPVVGGLLDPPSASSDPFAPNQPNPDPFAADPLVGSTGSPGSSLSGSGSLGPKSQPPAMTSIQPDSSLAHRSVSGPRQYIVRQGDSLWSISREHYGAGRYFRALGEHNRDAIGDPNQLSPGTEITIPDLSLLEGRMLAGRSSVAGLTGTIQTIEPTGAIAADTASVTARRPSANDATGLFYSEQGYPMYRVGRNDTLTSIAAKHLGRVSRWQQVYRMNQTTLTSPDNLQIGMVLKLPADASSLPLAE